LPRSIRAVLQLYLLLISGTSLADGQPSAYASPLDSQAWEIHFEAWIERMLVVDEMAAAADHTPPPHIAGPLRIADELVAGRVLHLGERVALPEGVEPQLAAAGVRGKALEAARKYAGGDAEAAMELLESDELTGDAGAVRLLVQLRDREKTDLRPSQYLDLIDEYRYALSLSGTSEVAPQTRIRIAQLYLEIGFWTEAAAELRPFLDPPFPAPLSQQATITFAEASYLMGDLKSVLATIEALDPATLDASALRWATRRRADSLFLQGEYAAALQFYEELVKLASGSGELEVSIPLRMAFARIQLGDLEVARTPLLQVLDRTEGEPQWLAGLLLARVHRRSRALDEMVAVANQTFATAQNTAVRALAGVYSLEGQRLAGLKIPHLTEGLDDAVRKRTESPEVALLSYLVALLPSHDVNPAETRDVLATLTQKLPDGNVRKLIEAEVSRRLHTLLVHAYREQRRVGPTILASLEEEIEPDQIEENGLLMAIHALRGAESWDACARWAHSLRKREVRPIRRGLGAWRELQCQRVGEAGQPEPEQLVRVADGGEAGPFALAIAAAAAEQHVRLGLLDEAVTTYQRGLASFVEPRILGPVLLRLGELQAQLGRHTLATRRIVRGLALTDSAATAADPLRKSGIVTLAHLAEQQRRTQRLKSTIQQERKRVESWWTSAYDYLGYRIGAGPQPSGTDVFARASRELREVEELESRIRALGLEPFTSKLEKKEGVE
jgi:tetratricopeptide (TPR) repeat protein